MAKLNFNIKMTMFDDEIQRAFKQLGDVGTKGTRSIMRQMRIEGLWHARELLDRLIYMTPQRGYTRTHDLENRVGGFVRNQGGVMTLFMYAGMPYSNYNELGTYDHRITEDEIIQRARQEMHDDLRLLILDFGERDPRKGGLEPRPFLFPTMVWLEVQLEKRFREAIQYAADIS